MGDVAEIGVYQGEFSQKINEAFPDRKLFLFDTFSGFPSDDKKYDQENLLHSHDDDFTKTSEKLVLSKMKTPENCIIKKGRFPETATNLPEKFVFVNIDTDLYLPSIEGLKYFYPKLSPGGMVCPPGPSAS